MVQAVFGFFDAVTGLPMANVECALDGVPKISGSDGVLTFSTTQGPHSYMIRAEGFKVGPDSFDPFGRPIYDQGEIIVEWLPDPSQPWPETSSFYSQVSMVEGMPSPPGPDIGKVIPVALILAGLLFLTRKK